MIIDAHTHIFAPRIRNERSLYYSDPLFNTLYSPEKAKLATADELIVSMDKNGIGMSLALNIGWSSNELCALNNDYIMEAVARNPDRIAGFGTVSLDNIPAAVKEIERCAQGGMKGIGEMRLERTIFTGADSRLAEFVQALTANKMKLLLHCSEPVGHLYPGKGDTTPELILNLVDQFPELELICAHWGGGLPFYALMPEIKRSISSMKFDTAASPFLYSPQIYRQVLDILGPESIIFGTDYPLAGQARPLREIRDLHLTPEEEENILSRNAEKYLALPTST